jgi:hypothetical protein
MDDADLKKLAEYFISAVGSDKATLAEGVLRLLAERDALKLRQTELLELIAKLTRETPYPAELDECRSARAALTLRSAERNLRAEIETMKELVKVACEWRKQAFRTPIGLPLLDAVDKYLGELKPLSEYKCPSCGNVEMRDKEGHCFKCPGYGSTWMYLKDGDDA